MARLKPTIKERRGFLFKLVGGLGLGLGGAALVGHSIKQSRRERQALKAVIERRMPKLENTETWARICQACR